MSERPFVSVVVPVRDNAAGIEELLALLDAQTYPGERFEVVVGDDGSSEPPAGVGTSDSRVRVVSGPPRNSYAARNRAVGAARGEVLAFVDSDCQPEATWLEEALSALDGADMAAGEIVFVAPERPTVWSLLTTDMFLDQERNVLLSRAVTANLLVRRKLFEELGGFDDSLPSGGDYDFVARAVERGARIAFAPNAVVRHPTLDDRKTFLRKIWSTNRWSGARRARAGERLEPAKAVFFVPFLGAALARREALRPVARLQAPRLEAAGFRANRWHEVRALSALYLLVAYVAGLARACGWIDGRRLARAAAGARPAEPAGAAERDA